MFSKNELKATKEACEQKQRDILDSKEQMTDMDILNLCTLAKLKEAAETKLKKAR